MQTRKLELFTTIHTEGSVLPVDILQRVLEGDSNIEGITPESYHLGAGEKINEAVNRSWNRLQGLWISFKNAQEKLAETESGTSQTREKWLLPLFQELGYGRLLTTKAIELEGKTYSISHGWHHAPIHLVSIKLDLDKKISGATGASKSSPHSLVQECLNASDDHLWGFVSNGLKLRILRDNKSITRQAFVEFDIESMMDGEVYSDFILLWMLCHQSRVEAEKPEECWLEKWSQTAQEQGTRALDQLRNGVERAITELGQGFISHPSNGDLRDKLKSGTLATQEYYRQLFRLVYRLLFLFVAEDRNLLLHPKASNEQRDLYNEHYSLTRLRRMASKIRGGKHVDAWDGARLVMDILSSDDGYEALGLPALGGYLFSDEAIPDLHDCDLSNHDFLTAVRSLAFIVDKGTLRPVDYKNLRSEEFGSVYESLLELHPVVNVDAGSFELKYAGGNERKTTASYYTHDSLVQCLLDSALDPVIDEAVKKDDPEKAILDLKVCDFASGSGHFLTAAAHRMAKRLAGIRTDEEEPAPEAIRTALRDVIGHCIYGVDINPMAVELCKVALWMEALEAGKPLSFLDHHIQCGNSLMGATPALLKKGIPDEAFTAIEGDDKAVCKEYKKRNKQEREKLQATLFDMESKPWMHLGNLTSAITAIDSIPDDTVDGVKQKQRQYEEFVRSTSSLYGKFLADTWCASFVWKKTNEFPYPITEEVFRNIEKNPYSAPKWLKEEVERLAKEYQFFHWQLAFPDVFYVGGNEENEQTGWSGGFDVVLSNPPWERVKLQEKEWFASHNMEIAKTKNASIRKNLISNLKKEDLSLFNRFLRDSRKAEGISLFLRTSELYPLCGRGDINLYTVFAELNLSLMNQKGRSGFVVPSGIATDESTMDYFSTLVQTKRLAKFIDFENRENLFQGVGHGRMKFALVTLGYCEYAEYSFQIWNVSNLLEKGRVFSLSAADIELLNPNTRTCPIFRTSREAEITKAIYRSLPIISSDSGHADSLWGTEFQRMIDMTNDSHLFLTEKALQIRGCRLVGNRYEDGTAKFFLPLYEAKMACHYDHRFGTYEGRTDDRESTALDTPSSDQHQDPDFLVVPRYWISEEYVPNFSWTLSFRAISHATNDRSFIAQILPRAGMGNSLVRVQTDHQNQEPLLYANFCSYIFDFVVRQKMGGLNLNFFIVKQLPVVPIQRYHHGLLEVPQAAPIESWVLPRVLELTYTAWDLQPFAQDCGYNGPPFKWDEERRFLLRSELDAAYFHLYGIGRADVDYIMETFPIVKRKDEAKYGEYRTKQVIMEMYDHMKAAMESGKEYRTWLNPPPADERVAHREQ